MAAWQLRHRALPALAVCPLLQQAVSRALGSSAPLLTPFFSQPNSREFSEKLPTGSDHFFQSLTLHIPHIIGILWMCKLLQ